MIARAMNILVVELLMTRAIHVAQISTSFQVPVSPLLESLI